MSSISPFLPSAAADGRCWLPDLGEITIYRSMVLASTPAAPSGRNHGLQDRRFVPPAKYRPIGVPGLQVAAGALRSLWETNRRSFGDAYAWEILSRLSRIELCALTADHRWGITDRGRMFVDYLGGPAPCAAWPPEGRVTEAGLSAFGFVIVPASWPRDAGPYRKVGGPQAGMSTTAHYTPHVKKKCRQSAEGEEW